MQYTAGVPWFKNYFRLVQEFLKGRTKETTGAGTACAFYDDSQIRTDTRLIVATVAAKNISLFSIFHHSAVKLNRWLVGSGRHTRAVGI